MMRRRDRLSMVSGTGPVGTSVSGRSFSTAYVRREGQPRPWMSREEALQRRNDPRYTALLGAHLSRWESWLRYPWSHRPTGHANEFPGLHTTLLTLRDAAGWSAREPSPSWTLYPHAPLGLPPLKGSDRPPQLGKGAGLPLPGWLEAIPRVPVPRALRASLRRDRWGRIPYRILRAWVRYYSTPDARQGPYAPPRPLPSTWSLPPETVGLKHGPLKPVMEQGPLPSVQSLEQWTVSGKGSARTMTANPLSRCKQGWLQARTRYERTQSAHALAPVRVEAFVQAAEKDPRALPSQPGHPTTSSGRRATTPPPLLRGARLRSSCLSAHYDLEGLGTLYQALRYKPIVFESDPDVLVPPGYRRRMDPLSTSSSLSTVPLSIPKTTVPLSDVGSTVPPLTRETTVLGAGDRGDDPVALEAFVNRVESNAHAKEHLLDMDSVHRYWSFEYGLRDLWTVSAETQRRPALGRYHPPYSYPWSSAVPILTAPGLKPFLEDLLNALDLRPRSQAAADPALGLKEPQEQAVESTPENTADHTYDLCIDGHGSHPNSHGSHLNSHDLNLKGHDLHSKGQDQGMESHDQGVGGYDPQGVGHDPQGVGHDLRHAGHDPQSVGHDLREGLGGHDRDGRRVAPEWGYGVSWRDGRYVPAKASSFAWNYGHATLTEASMALSAEVLQTLSTSASGVGSESSSVPSSAGSPGAWGTEALRWVGVGVERLKDPNPFRDRRVNTPWVSEQGRLLRRPPRPLIPSRFWTTLDGAIHATTRLIPEWLREHGASLRPEYALSPYLTAYDLFRHTRSLETYTQALLYPSSPAARASTPVVNPSSSELPPGANAPQGAKVPQGTQALPGADVSEGARSSFGADTVTGTGFEGSTRGLFDEAEMYRRWGEPPRLKTLRMKGFLARGEPLQATIQSLRSEALLSARTAAPFSGLAQESTPSSTHAPLCPQTSSRGHEEGLSQEGGIPLDEWGYPTVPSRGFPGVHGILDAGEPQTAEPENPGTGWGRRRPPISRYQPALGWTGSVFLDRATPGSPTASMRWVQSVRWARPLAFDVPIDPPREEERKAVYAEWEAAWAREQTRVSEDSGSVGGRVSKEGVLGGIDYVNTLGWRCVAGPEHSDRFDLSLRREHQRGFRVRASSLRESVVSMGEVLETTDRLKDVCVESVFGSPSTENLKKPTAGKAAFRRMGLDRTPSMPSVEWERVSEAERAAWGVVDPGVPLLGTDAYPVRVARMERAQRSGERIGLVWPQQGLRHRPRRMARCEAMEAWSREVARMGWAQRVRAKSLNRGLGFLKAHIRLTVAPRVAAQSLSPRQWFQPEYQLVLPPHAPYALPSPWGHPEALGGREVPEARYRGSQRRWLAKVHAQREERRWLASHVRKAAKLWVVNQQSAGASVDPRGLAESTRVTAPLAYTVPLFKGWVPAGSQTP